LLAAAAHSFFVFFFFFFFYIPPSSPTQTGGPGATYAILMHGGPATPFLTPHVPFLTALSAGLAHPLLTLYPHQRGSGLSSRIPWHVPNVKSTSSTDASLAAPRAAPAYREYGQLAGRVEAALGIRAQLRDIERLCAAAVPSRRAVLIGHSFGGFLASLLAAERPDLPAALVLLCPAACLVTDPKEDLFRNVEDGLRRRAASGGSPDGILARYAAWKAAYLDFSPRLFTRGERELAALHAQFYEFWLEAFANDDGGKKAPASADDSGSGSSSSSNQNGDVRGSGAKAATAGGRLDPALCGGWAMSAQYMSMGAVRDFRAALRAVTCPVLIVHGARDVQSVAVSKGYQASFGGPVDLRVIENTGHFPMDETPEELAEIIAEFLARHGLDQQH
jgi:pimeloyl-ACP methyl ester carboxylesterase